MKKVGIFGTHGTGKTTLCCALAAYYKHRGSNVKIIQETVRECPFPINLSMSADAGLWVYHAHIKKELDALVQDFQLCLCDRTALDSLVYVYAQDVGNRYTKIAEQNALQWMETYDMLIYVTMSESHAVEADGVRPADVDFQKRVQDAFDMYVEQLPESVTSKMKCVCADDIFGEFQFPPAIQKVDSFLYAATSCAGV